MEARDPNLLVLEAELIPTAEERAKHLAGDEGLPDSERVKAIFRSEAIEALYSPMTIQSEDDWIPSMRNKPQTFKGYVRSGPNPVTESRHTIYI